VFCPIAKIELKVESCPTQSCPYKGVGGSCNYERLTSDAVDVHTIAEVRQQKTYVVKSAANTAKQQVKLGLIIMKYANFIKDSFPERTVNKTGEDKDHVSRVLSRTFRLSTAQQQKFWDADRFNEWSARANLKVTLQDIRQAVLASSPI
jgi:hypothetical protein